MLFLYEVTLNICCVRNQPEKSMLVAYAITSGLSIQLGYARASYACIFEPLSSR